MAKVHVITDSTALFEYPHAVEDYNITVIPMTIWLNDKPYQDGIDIDDQIVLDRVRSGGEIPRITAPSIEDFEAVYQRIARSTDQIIVLVNSRQFTEAYAHAQTARSLLLGRCEIMVLDSKTTSAGLGYLVEATAKAARSGMTLDEVVHIARGLISRLYSVFYVNELETIQKAGLLGETQALLGTMLEIKPLLTIEDGSLITMEKARTHARAIDKMIEFVMEFTDIQRLCILQSSTRITEQTRMLQDRLALEFGRHQTHVMLFDPLLTSRLGPDGMGLVILEGEEQDGSFL